MGDVYLKGLGVDKDYQKALECYKKGADIGHATAQHQLGYMYENGLGVKVDNKLALEWYQKAVDFYLEANNSIGLMYANGKGVPKNIALARTYFQKAANNGSAEGKKNLEALPQE